MCKLAFSKTSDETAYQVVLNMLRHQENTCAGHSTGITYHKNGEVFTRKAIGKVINFMAEYPDIPRTNIALAHSRFASVGAINKANQHPIGIRVNGKRIGYAVHNGHWGDYTHYEYLRNPSLSNVTDSALLFTIYGKLLEKYGDTHENRRRAFANIIELNKHVYTRNFIFLFDDGQILFAGTQLTFQQFPSKFGIMTFGLPNHVEDGKIYELQGMTLHTYPLQALPMPFQPRQETKGQKTIQEATGIKWTQPNIPSFKPTRTEQTHLQDFKKIDNKVWKLINDNFNTQNSAQMFGAIIKKRHSITNFKANFRVIQNNKGKYSLYMRRERI